MHRYTIGKKNMTLLTGIRAYHGYSTSKQGHVFNGNGADFDFPAEGTEPLHDFSFPNLNLAAFAEQIIRITDKWNITPGVRAEYIKTKADGRYRSYEQDLAGGYTFDTTLEEHRSLPRTFVIAGIGSSYKLKPSLEVYGNISQNYRSVTFSDIRVTNKSFEIDPNIEDEKGYSGDLGVRGSISEVFRFDASGFYMHYGNRIGEYNTKNELKQVIRKRGNIGAARIVGLETFMEMDILEAFNNQPKDVKTTVYSNLSLTKSEYTKSHLKNIVGNEVEYVPTLNWRAGIQTSFRKFKLTYQFSHLSDQYTDVTNEVDGGYSAVNGLVPAYTLMDLSAGYSWKWLTLEASVNNLANVSYFTRRATGYPGPGIIPGEGRSFYLTVGFKTL